MSPWKYILRRALLPILIAAQYLCLSSCSHHGSGSGVQGGSYGRDALGHRPGPKGFTTVIIDAGHGGHDSGALGRVRGQTEKALALDTAYRLKRMLSGRFNVVMLRPSDRFVDLDKRVVKANRYRSAILVSLHYNSSRSRRARGPETYYWRVDSHGIAKRIQWALKKVNTSSRSRGLVRRRLRLTRNPKIPCTLVEFGYISHYSESQRCKSPAYRERLARAVADAIIEQAEKGDEGTGRLPRPLNQPLSKATDARGS